jgi:Flp pilus assembly protein TadG
VRRASRGQAAVEFSLVVMLMLVIVLGIMDFGYLFAGRAITYQATRVAVRFAATHPTAWSAVANPDRTSIEGNLKLTAVPAAIPNLDANITIDYLVPGPGAATVCGHWTQAAGGSFVANSGYTQATCVLRGNLVRVQAKYTYLFITPMLKATFTSLLISTSSTALIEV